MLKKLAFIAPLLALIALLIWWFTPRYAEEDVAYYRSVFCVIDHQDSRAFLRDMENMIEGGNSDYALHKTHYVPALIDILTLLSSYLFKKIVLEIIPSQSPLIFPSLNKQ